MGTLHGVLSMGGSFETDSHVVKFHNFRVLTQYYELAVLGGVGGVFLFPPVPPRLTVGKHCNSPSDGINTAAFRGL